jgi:CheY-like chemotaxis protein
MATILLIEDEPTLSDMYQLMLQLKGHTVDTARNGSDGIVKAQQSKPQVILLDMMMPVLSGIETLKQLKADLQLKEVPVVMLSNLADDQQADLAKKEGAANYVIKSDCTADSLHQLVSAIVSSGQPSEQAPGRLVA